MVEQLNSRRRSAAAMRGVAQRPAVRRSAARVGQAAIGAGRAVLDLLLPGRCLWCGDEAGELPGDCLLCQDCRKLFACNDPPRCPRCAATIATPTAACADCHGRRLHFDSAVTLGSYTGALREGVWRLKRPGAEPLAGALATLLYERRRAQLTEAAPEVVVAVPMHWLRRLVRRTNSPELLAATLADRLALPPLHRALARQRNTRRQGPLMRTNRLENVRGAFRLRSDVDVRGKRVLVVDDVLTSGATCDEIAKVLKRAGAAAVTACILARADASR